MLPEECSNFITQICSNVILTTRWFRQKRWANLLWKVTRKKKKKKQLCWSDKSNERFWYLTNSIHVYHCKQHQLRKLGSYIRPWTESEAFWLMFKGFYFLTVKSKPPSQVKIFFLVKRIFCLFVLIVDLLSASSCPLFFLLNYFYVERTKFFLFSLK